MTSKREMIERLSEFGYTKKDSAVIINDMVHMMIEALANGETIVFPGFGKFEIHEYPPRNITLPDGKTKMQVPARKVANFTAGKLLKRCIREGFVRS